MTGGRPEFGGDMALISCNDTVCRLRKEALCILAYLDELWFC